MDVDEALGRLGTVGRWQILHYTLISVGSMFPTCFHFLAIIYIGAWPEHHCRVTDGSLVNETIPVDKHGEYVKCEMYVNEERNKTDKCSEWQYIDDDIGPTIVTKWDLVCERAYLKDLTQTGFSIGMMFGAMICTLVSDKFGRKPVFLISQWAMVVVGVANAFIPNYYAFIVFRFLTGLIREGILLPSFVMACELFAAKHRTFAGTLIGVFWAIATCFLALLAYLVQNWVNLQLTISLLGLLTVPLYWVLSESVVWLCANNRVDEAEEVIRKAAKLNNITMPDKILARSRVDDIVETVDGDDGRVEDGKLLNKCDNQSISEKREKKTEPSDARYSIIDIFRNRYLTINTLCTMFLWVVVILVYYGLCYSAGQLAGNFYVNNFISGMVEIPAYLCSYFAMKKLGRKRSLITYYAVAGISLVLSQVIPEQAGDVSLIAVRITFSMIGKFGISSAISVIYLYTPEIFPTTLRSQSLGISTTLGGIGGLIAPFISLLAVELAWLPGVLLGGLSLAASLLTTVLPETVNRPLPQTIDDIEQWYKRPVNQQEMIAMRKVKKQTINTDVNTQ